METNNQLQTTQANEPSPVTLIQTAIEKGIDVDKLTRLFDLQERWEKKEAEKAFNAAFAKFQKECPEIKKNKKGHFAYHYADLGQIIKQIKEPMASNGLNYRWVFKQKDNEISCTCIISHIDGHSKDSGEFSAPKDDSGGKNIIQQIGSTRTYLERYTLISVLGISSADTDNDAKTTSKPPEVKKTPEDIQKQKQITEKWKKEFQTLKTPTEIKLNVKDLCAKAEKDGANMDELKQFVRTIHDTLKANNKKADMKIAGNETVKML